MCPTGAEGMFFDVKDICPRFARAWHPTSWRPHCSRAVALVGPTFQSVVLEAGRLSDRLESLSHRFF